MIPFSRLLAMNLGLFAGLIMAAAPPAKAQVGAPVIQTRFTADPAPMVHDGVVYLYTSHDEDDASGFKMLDWQLYSSTDMVNWTDRGTVASLKTFPWAVQTNDAWAPQVIARNGKFYLYVPISVPGSPKNVIAVAVADKPEGPFTDVLGKPLIAAHDGFIDPTVWIDDDGQAYLYWGNPDLWYVKLNKDMTSYAGPITKVDRIFDYQEGPWFYKHDNRYYMAFASTCCSEGIGYAMSDKPTGPWIYKGPIMDHDGRATGNHPGIIDYKGGSYLFGFNYELNFAMTPIHHERRAVSVAKFEYNADGTIPNLHWWDVIQAPQIETLDPYQRVEAETIAWTSRIKRDRDRRYDWAPGVTTARNAQSGVYVTRTLDRTYIKIAGVNFGPTSPRRFVASVANGVPGSSIELHLDRVDGPVIGTLQVGETGATGQWQERGTSISGAVGNRDLYLVFRGAGDRALFDFDYWRFLK
ncbi:glycoside hydrolase family 43 protein [Sphingomonas paucimobilis]|uniref:glycoside hydrolase family 43 protein n=1 Tax=Sphingomonas paucimobilis TaxID=13689 RepID=UPI003D8EBCD7